MAKKLWIATVEFEFVMVSEGNEAGVELDAWDIVRGIDFGDESSMISVREPTRVKMPDGKRKWYLPEDYTEECLPWGEDDGDKTIGEYLKEIDDDD